MTSLSEKIEGYALGNGHDATKLRVEDVREVVLRLKEELCCHFCKSNPLYTGVCTECHNAGIKIDEIFGEKLI